MDVSPLPAQPLRGPQVGLSWTHRIARNHQAPGGTGRSRRVIRASRGDTGVVETGPELLDSVRDRRRVPLPRWSSVLLLPLSVVFVAVGLGRAGPGEPVRELDPTALPTTRPTTLPSSPPVPPIAVVTLGHSLLGVTAGWELFGRGAE